MWWDLFIEGWNGVALFLSLARSRRRTNLTSDASGGWGCGAFAVPGEWLQVRWPESWKSIHITVKELLPIVIACALWGASWQGHTVECLCENTEVAPIVRSGTSKHPLAMHLFRCLSCLLSIVFIPQTFAREVECCG